MDVDKSRGGVLPLNRKTFVLIAVVVAVFAACLIALQYQGSDNDAKADSTIFLDGLKYEVVSLDEKTVQVKGYEGNPVYLTVPDMVVIDGLEYNVVSIAKNAFKKCGSLKSLTLGANVTEIGESAFEGCKSLSQLDLNKVQKIGKKAFKDVSSIPDLVLPDTVVDVGMFAFENIKLETLTVPVTLQLGNGKHEGDSQFKGCEGLKYLTVTKGKDGVSADYDKEGWDGSTPWSVCYNTLEEAVFEEGVKSIGYAMFSGNVALKSVTLPSTLEKIPNSAFDRCIALTSIVIPDSVKEIGKYSFFQCFALTEITMPISLDSVVNDNSGAFAQCENITTVTLTKGSVEKVNEDETEAEMEARTGIGHDYGDNTYTPWRISKDSFTTLVVGDGVKVIGDYTFKNCSSLTSVTLPDSLTEIKHSAFEGCTSVKNLTLPSALTTIGESAFKGCTSVKNLTLPSALTTIGKSAFEGCNTFEGKLDLSKITSLGSYAFKNCNALKDVVIPTGIDKLNRSVFENCKALKSVTIPGNITSLERSTFKGCTGITELTVPIGVNTVVKNGDPAFEGCTAIEKVVFTGNGDGFNYEDNTYTPWKISKSLKTVVLSEGIQSIGKNTFRGLKGDIELVLPGSLMSIGDSALKGFAFFEADGVTSITPTPENLRGKTFAGETARMVEQ